MPYSKDVYVVFTLRDGPLRAISMLDMHFVRSCPIEDQDFYSPKIVGVRRDF
ncbi:MAG: hypothetical protein ABSF82_07335 [Candidatus Bathyarchaeia archaeon]